MANQDWTADEWQELVKEQQQSGQTARAWCIAEGINYRAFLCHARKQISGQSEETADEIPSGWAQAKSPETEPIPCVLRIEVGGCRIEVEQGFDPALLAEVCAALRSLC